MKILKTIWKVIQSAGTAILVLLGILALRGRRKDGKKERKKIKEDMKKGARRFGRPIGIFLLLILLTPTATFSQYTNINYSEGVNWNWYSESHYVGYCQFYITNCHKLLNTYYEPSWLETVWNDYKFPIGILLGVTGTILIFNVAIK